MRHQQRDSTNMLRRPVELAAFSRPSKAYLRYNSFSGFHPRSLAKNICKNCDPTHPSPNLTVDVTAVCGRPKKSVESASARKSVAKFLQLVMTVLQLRKNRRLGAHSQQKLSQVARQLNERPRKTLDYETPAERFNQYVASTS